MVLHPEFKHLCIVEEARSTAESVAAKKVQVGSRLHGEEFSREWPCIEWNFIFPCLNAHTYARLLIKRFS